MAVESLTIRLDDDESDVRGSSLISGDVDDNQIVTVLDDNDDSIEGETFTFERWGKDAPTEPGAGPGGDDVFNFDLSGFDDSFTILVKSLDSQDCFVFTNFDTLVRVGNIYTITYTGSDGDTHVITMDAESQNGTGVVCVCFGRGTGILTPEGEVPIEDLSAGDMVMCGDGKERPIRWIGSRAVDHATLTAHPELRPIQFEPSALGEGLPERPLTLSPQHRVLLQDWRAELLFGADEVLAPAKALVNDTGIRVDRDCTEVEYFHILLDDHQTVLANGLRCETLIPAEMAQYALPPEARDEICKLFPEIVADLYAYGETCAPALKPYEVQALLTP